MSMRDVPGLSSHRSRITTNRRRASTSPISPINRVPSSFATDRLDRHSEGCLTHPRWRPGIHVQPASPNLTLNDDVVFSRRRSFCVVLSSLPFVPQLETARLVETIYSQCNGTREGRAVCRNMGVDACRWVIRVLCESSCASYVHPAVLFRAQKSNFNRRQKSVFIELYPHIRYYSLKRIKYAIFKLILKEIKQND